MGTIRHYRDERLCQETWVLRDGCDVESITVPDHELGFWPQRGKRLVAIARSLEEQLRERREREARAYEKMEQTEL